MKTPSRTQKIYENFKVLSKDGDLMFITSEKRANWYLSRNLADVIDPTTIKLNFETNGVGAQFDKHSLSKKENKCVVCGEDDLSKLEKHHIVPREYRKYLPLNVKSHNSHDIVPICTKCHRKYEHKFAILKKRALAKRYRAPIDYDPERKAITLSHQYVTNEKIPETRRIEIRKLIDKNFRLMHKRNAKDTDIIKLSNINIKEYDIQRAKHGMIVVSKIKNKNLFIKRWRIHFVESMNPQFLPEFWSVDYSRDYK